MRSLYPTPKPRPQDQQKPSRPESRQSRVSAAGNASSEDKTVRRKPSATILTRTPINRITAAAPSFRTRTPLRPRDHNVAPASTRSLTTTTAPMRNNLKAAAPPTTMPLEKDAARRPQMPTLAKNINRAPPVTPKIAAKVASPSPQQQLQTVTVATPLPRRNAPRPDSASKSEIASGGGGHPRDEFVSPASALLGPNVTPRSGSRQVRVDSANTTPNGTPHLDRSDSWETRSGLGISSPSLDERIRQAPPSLASKTSADSKFFFASDAKQQQMQQATSGRPLNPVPKASTFFYANGNTLPGGETAFTPALGAASTPPATATQDPLSSKFVYANGAPELQSPLKMNFPPAPSSVVSTASRAPSRPPTVAPTSYPSQRPPSPVKTTSYPPPLTTTTTTTKNGPQLALNRGAMASAPQLVATSTALRQTSNESKTSAHSRNGSLSVAEPVAVSRLLASLPGSSASSPVIAAANPAAGGGLASILQMAEDFADSDDGKLYSELHSPTKSTHAQDQLDELVITARRERKVQDLEITNASLEAINRSLERQLRKQKAELRQFRRLSRSGRLSLAPSTRIASTSTVEGPLNDPAHMLSDLSEADSEPEDDYFEDGSDYSDSESGSSSDLSPGIVAKRDARHRKQDEKRLQLDLSKHRQLLVDSQKINQSIKRCLGWTEELIKEGKKALEFQVRVSEVELGGRVLSPQDEEDDDSDRDGEGSRAEDDTIRLRHDEEEPSSTWDKETQDRDSGVEMPVDGG